MLATSMGENKLTLINTETEQPEYAIAVGGVPRPVAIESGPEGKHGPPVRPDCPNLHGFVVVDSKARVVIDKLFYPTTAGRAAADSETFSHGIGIAPDGKTMWVCSLLDNSVSVYSMPGPCIGWARFPSVKVPTG